MSHEERSAEMEDALEQMEERSGELKGDIEQAGDDWDAKQGDSGVPGAQPTEDELAAEADRESHGPATGAEDVEDER
jgi:hypothetical protein